MLWFLLAALTGLVGATMVLQNSNAAAERSQRLSAQPYVSERQLREDATHCVEEPVSRVAEPTTMPIGA